MERNSLSTFIPATFHGLAKPSSRPLLAALALMSLSQFAKGQVPPPPGANPSDPACIVTQTDLASWFEAGTVTANGAVKPADSVSFPNVPNCSFYKWSEQMFLWLTSPQANGQGIMLDSPVFYDVSTPDANGNLSFIPHTGRPSSMTVRRAKP